MRCILGLATLHLAALAACSTGTLAQDSGLRGAFPKKVPGCFKRVYDSTHLARNETQSVSVITLARGPAELRREAIDGPEAPQLALRLSLTLRRGGGAGPEPLGCFSSAASEGEHGGKDFLQCVSTCGRGHLDLVPDGADRVVLKIGGTVQGRFIADAIGVGRSCATEAGIVWLGDEPGDRTFVLERVPLKECR